MAHLRSQGKAKTLAPGSKIGRQRRTRKSTQADAPASSEESASRNTRRRSSQRTKLDQQPTSSPGRRTRSQKGAVSHERLSTPPKRKRRSTVADSQEQPPKRQRNEDAGAVEEEPHGHASDDQSAPLSQDFYTKINESARGEQLQNLPQLRLDNSVEHPTETESRMEIAVEASQDGARDEEAHMAEVDVVADSHRPTRDVSELEEEGSAPAKGQQELDKPVEQPESIVQSEGVERDDAESRPAASHPRSSQPGKWRKRQQSQKAPFGEATYQEPRGASPDLGSKMPSPQAKRFSTRGRPRISTIQEDPYEFQGSDEEESPQKEMQEQEEKSNTATEATSKRKQSQPQSTQPRPTENEEEPETEDEDEDVPESDQAPDGSESEAHEDSLFIDPSGEDEATIRVKIHGRMVQKLFTLMTFSAWTGKRKWAEDVRVKVHESEPDRRKKPAGRSEALMFDLYDLWGLCSEIPRAPHFERQHAYQREKAGAFKKSISTISYHVERYASYITTRMESSETNSEEVKNGRIVVKQLYRRIIPMLVFILKQAFLAGCDESSGEDADAVKQNGEFTKYILQLLERTTGWIKRLGHVMLGWLELHPPKLASQSIVARDRARNIQAYRQKLIADTGSLQKALEDALKKHGELAKAPERDRREREKRERALREREEQEKKLREAQDLQMQRFILSTQRKRLSRPTAHRSTQASNEAANQSTWVASQSLSGDEYFEKHGGWRYWEDDRLLNTIRNTLRPNYRVLTDMLPGRSIEEVEQRAKHLRMNIRRKYEKAGWQPPAWSYDEV
ncbi:hypothetical protein NM208_g14232 [Fusarium decemcellulare]|uniref:Uncharacterized protein n=1 Tax=Fusarium decemcellulare TaxID=57161 RepID=A0ACC1RJD7_9HYPO|nr:hypothetical protein NM208_g14232 [Fusarium decemcellulare]